MTIEVRANQDSRVAAVYADDAQLRASEPIPTVRAAARRPGLRLVQVLQTLFEGYADRPALGNRASTVATDPATGHAERALLPAFATTTYGDPSRLSPRSGTATTHRSAPVTWWQVSASPARTI
jgi:fatty acid CoA ligase FadD9